MDKQTFKHVGKQVVKFIAVELALAALFPVAVGILVGLGCSVVELASAR